jgi:hypothetical protein
MFNILIAAVSAAVFFFAFAFAFAFSSFWRTPPLRFLGPIFFLANFLTFFRSAGASPLLLLLLLLPIFLLLLPLLVPRELDANSPQTKRREDRAPS